MSESLMLLTVLRGLVGFVGMISVIVFIYGISLYIARLGTTRRNDAIRVLEWSVRIAITTILLIGILNFVTGLVG